MHTRDIVILVAEDDPVDRELLLEGWREKGFRHPIQFVENGAELLNYLKRLNQYSDTSTYPTPDLILLDLNMPMMDGREALNNIKQDKNLRCTPVIVFTTSNELQDVERSYDLGANSYILKPSDFKHMLDVLETLVHYWAQIVELPPKRH